MIENIFTDWYITEKLAEPLAALSIPIYFGNPLISEYLPNLFSYAAINGHDFTDTASLVRYLKQMTNREYTERVERVREYRSEYFNLTDYKTIWEYALATLLGTETIIQNNCLNGINTKFAERNTNRYAIAKSQELQLLINSNLDGTEYDVAVRKMLWNHMTISDR